MAPIDDGPTSDPRTAGRREVYLGLGANLGDRIHTLGQAVERLAVRDVLRDLRASAVYETDPVALEPQPLYLNAVVRGQSRLSPGELLSACLEIEAELGRVRFLGHGKAPRVIDIDLLLYGAEVVDTPTLQVPHPALLKRPFVLIPLADVASPDLKHPITSADLSHAAPSVAVRWWGPPLVPIGVEE